MVLSFFRKLFSKPKVSNPLWNDLIVGKIIKAEQHPNADRLKICTVDCGAVTRTIVCGGVNVRAGMLSAVAVPGAKVYLGGSPELAEIKSVVVRGVVSDGMLCGPDEIGLLGRFPKQHEKEIIDLSALVGVEPGQKLSEIL